MATIHRDDVTGEEYQTDSGLYEYSLYIGGMQYDAFESASPADVESEEHLEEVANELRAMVDEWEANEREYIQGKDNAE
jgi:hypothetical protein